MRALLLTALALVLVTGLAQAEDAAPNDHEAERQHILPGLGTDEHPRIVVNPQEGPWRALARVQVPGNSICTGFMISPTQVVTAAHCLWGYGLQRFEPASAIHVLGEYSRGNFSGQAVVTAYRLLEKEYDPKFVSGADVAVLQLDHAIVPADAPLKPAPRARSGEKVMLGGYNQDRGEVIEADEDCTLIDGQLDRHGQPLLHHDCSATHGTSGAPLLTKDDDGTWVVLGVQIAAVAGHRGGLAVPIVALRAMAGP